MNSLYSAVQTDRLSSPSPNKFIVLHDHVILKLLGSVQAQLHTHVNMFICKPLDYIRHVIYTPHNIMQRERERAP